MDTQQLLDFVRGPGLQIATAVFVLGMVYRMLHLMLLGRKKNLAAPRGSEWGPGLRTMWHRSLISVALTPRGYFILITGYVFHLGFLITLLFLSQHIDLFRSALGLGWPALPTGLITIAAILTIGAMIALLVHRFTDPVKHLISDYQDYLTWTLTFLPLLTGKGAYGRTAAFAEDALDKMVVNECYKLVRSPTQPLLFDMQADPNELNNLIGKLPQVEKEMGKLLDDWLAATPPVRKPNPSPVRKPAAK